MGGALYTLTVPVAPRPPEAVVIAPVALAEDAPPEDTRTWQAPVETSRPVAAPDPRSHHDIHRHFEREAFGAP